MCVVARPRAGRPGDRIAVGTRCFSFPPTSIPNPGPAQPPVQWVSGFCTRPEGAAAGAN